MGIDDKNKTETEEQGLTQVTKGRYPIHCLTIIGQIEGHFESGNQIKTTKYEHVIPQLVDVQEDEQIDGLLIILNTVGGDVEAGLAIAEVIAGMRKPTATLVLGGSHSIGVALAVAGKRSFIPASAVMMIHPVRMTGLVIGAPQTFRYFMHTQERIMEFVTSHSNISKEKFNDLMMATDEIANDVGTIVDGRQAVEYGLIDCLGSLGEALDYLHSEIERKKDMQ